MGCFFLFVCYSLAVASFPSQDTHLFIYISQFVILFFFILHKF